ncbi:addiction module protein [Halomonas lysinitropha]|uniref:addiction module protein n=1 Tax=Halomonas lysinitropha TaxID=2607506 RepID=UPI00124A83C6
MSTREKLRAMEALWDDLTRDPESVPVPDWHREELEIRSARAEADGDAFSEWEAAKRRLRESSR